MANYVSSFPNGEAVDAELTKVQNSNLSATHKITRSATIVIAASDSSAKSKSQADYVCIGTNDHAVIQAALNALPITGGELHFLEGQYNFGAKVSRAINYVKITGSGMATYFKYNNTDFLIDVGTNVGWTFSDFRIDTGSIKFTDSTHWSLVRVYRDDQSGDYPIEINWSYDAMCSASFGSRLKSQLTEFHKLVAVIDDMESSDWTTSDGTLTWDTTVIKNGTQSAKLVSGVGTSASMSKTIPAIDMTNGIVGLRVYSPNSNDIAKIICTIGDSSFMNTLTVSKTNYAGVGLSWDNSWYDYTFVPISGSITGSPDISNITGIKITVTPAAGKQATIYCNEVRFGKNVLSPDTIFTFVFDDGNASDLKLAKPILDKYGWKAVSAVSPAKINTSELYANMTELKQLYNSGWDITNHSFDHNALKSINDSVFQYGYTQKWLLDHGFVRGSENIVYAYGYFNPPVLAFAEQNTVFQRSFGGGSNCLPAPSTLLGTLNVNLNSGNSLSQYFGWIDTINLYNLWSVITFHSLVQSGATGSQTNVADFEAIVDYVHQKGAEVLTFSQIEDRILATSQSMTLSGSSTISSGSTSIDIRHGFHKAPKSIQITPTSSLGTASSIWVSSKDTGTGNLFTVSVDVDPGADVTFDWTATL